MQGKSKPRKTPICSTCGCSLVRLGITKLYDWESQKNKALHVTIKVKIIRSAAKAALSFLTKNPESLLKETSPLEVCPSCLAEKPINQTICLDHKGETLYFCRCPHCVTVFHHQPEYYLQRLSGEIEYLIDETNEK